MPSIHVWKAIDKAAAMGAYAGAREAIDLWDMSKREIIEIALRLGEICCDEGGRENAIARVREERDILRANGII